MSYEIQRSAGPTVWINVVACLCGVILLGVLIAPHFDRTLGGRNDFIQLYAGATLSGSPELYSLSANKEMQLATVGALVPGVYYSRPAYYALLLKPLSLLPYLQAYLIWEALSAAALIAFLWLYLPKCRELLLFASFSIPLLSSLAVGQDVTFVLLTAGGSFLLAERKRDFASGAVLALCASKAHLFVLLPLVALVCGRLRILYGGVTVGGVLVALSFLSGGRDWLAGYLRMLSNPELHNGSDHMPNIHGLLAGFGITNVWTEAFLGVVVASLGIYFAFLTRDYVLAAAVNMVAGLLISFHAYTQDSALLLLTFAIVTARCRSKAVHALLAVALLPPMYLLLLSGAPYNLVLPATLIAVMAAAVWAARAPERFAVAPVASET